jgi:hypothetical protein
MILSARYVHRPREHHWCDWCGTLESHIRLYGRAHDCDPMSMLRLHPTERCCPNLSGDVKIAAAIAQGEPS